MSLLKVDAQGLTGKALEIAVEKDIERFNEYFVKLGTPVAKNDPLDKYEKAAIKTYLWWKVNVDGAATS